MKRKMTFIFHFDNTVTNVRINILSSLPAPSGYEKPLKGLLYASRESGAAVEGAECGAQLLKAELQRLQAALGARGSEGGSRHAARLLTQGWGAAQDQGLQSLACKEGASGLSELVWSPSCTKVKHRGDPKCAQTQRHGKSLPGCARAGLFREKT